MHTHTRMRSLKYMYIPYLIVEVVSHYCPHHVHSHCHIDNVDNLENVGAATTYTTITCNLGRKHTPLHCVPMVGILPTPKSIVIRTPLRSKTIALATGDWVMILSNCAKVGVPRHGAPSPITIV